MLELRSFCTLVGACTIFVWAAIAGAWLGEWTLRITGISARLQARRDRRRAIARLLEDVRRHHHSLTR